MMAESGDVSLDTLRAALSLRRAATSLRKVAAEVGVNPTTIHQIVRGTVQPRPKTLRRLRSWYEGQPAPIPELAALDTLLGRIAEGPARARAGELVRTVLRLGYEESGLPVPAWVRRRTAAELRIASAHDRRRQRAPGHGAAYS